MAGVGEVKIPIDGSFTDTVCNYGAGFIKLQYRVGTTPVAGTGTFVRLGKVSGIITAGHVIVNLPRPTVGLVRFPRVQPGFQRFELDMGNTEEAVTWNNEEGDAPDIGFLRIPEVDARTLEARGAVFYNLEADRMFVPSDPANRVAEAHAIVGVVAEWTEEIPGGKQGERKAIIGGLFGAAKRIREFQGNGTDLVEVGIDHTTGPSVPESYGGVSGGALWKLHVELDATGKIVSIGKELRGVAFRESDDPRLITCNDLPSITALKQALAAKWPNESGG
jgi:hypothetical protein